MIGVVIITHGNLASEMLETVKLIMGEHPAAVAVSFTARESIDTLRERAGKAVEMFRSEGCIILTDVLGGSATNVCVDFLKLEGIRVITGVNLPMVMEALQSREKLPLDALSKKIREGAARGIIDLKEFFAERAMKKKA
ncbi:MAG: PTS fructose transporter subunit IIA [Candidatus Ozemobacteraceae bacterium]